MLLKKIKIINYEYEYDELIKEILYKAKEPILIKIKNFPDKFSLDYFHERFCGDTTYTIFEKDICVGHQSSDLETALSEIKNNKPYRIFGQIFPKNESSKIESYVPLWQKLPLRPRFFNKNFKVSYYFGGHGAHTEMHYDREHSCNLHLCLSGKKEILLFTENQSEHIYKLPFISNSFIDFGYPMDYIRKNFPKINQAQGYKVTLETGDMLFMPRNCWHYTTYLAPSAAATYAFYPKKFFHLYGYLTGHFFCGFKDNFRISEWSFIKKFSQNYVLAKGWKKICYKTIEKTLFSILFLPISIFNMLAKK